MEVRKALSLFTNAQKSTAVSLPSPFPE